jgi:hypothetical protein
MDGRLRSFGGPRHQSRLDSHDAFVRLDTWGAFARNLSAVSALVALSFCLASLSSRKSGLPISARAGIASFGWVLVPIIALMTFLPRGMTRVELVLAVVGLAHALILLLILAGLHWRSTRATSVALVLTLVASFSGIISMIVSMVGERTYWQHTDRLANAFRWSGELAYLAADGLASSRILQSPSRSGWPSPFLGERRAARQRSCCQHWRPASSRSGWPSGST